MNVQALTWYLGTSFKWISSISCGTVADGLMVVGIAQSIDSAGTLARIFTLLPDTSLIWRTLPIDKTFWMAVWWSSKVTLLTATHRSRTFKLTDGVGAARAWEATLTWSLRLRYDS
jgi:hypothetical protein